MKGKIQCFKLWLIIKSKGGNVSQDQNFILVLTICFMSYHWSHELSHNLAAFTFSINFELLLLPCLLYTTECNVYSELTSLSSIFTASTWSIIKSRDSFEILRTCRFTNWPYFWNLVKIWGSYCQKTKKRNSENHPLVVSLYRQIDSLFFLTHPLFWLLNS